MVSFYGGSDESSSPITLDFLDNYNDHQLLMEYFIMWY
jgi:hypothetical protein